MTELHSGKLYWPETAERTVEFPVLKEDISCDVVIVGGGMAGALCAEELSHTQLKVAVIDKGEVGKGSSSANTGLLQYSNDKMLHEFIEEIGEEKAVAFYKLCLEAVEELQKVAGTLPGKVDFVRRPSLYYASDEGDIEKLKKEYEALTEHGFEVEYLDRDQIEELYGFSKPAALMTHGDAEVNPYRLIRSLFESAEARGVSIFEHTSLEHVQATDEGKHLFYTTEGSITAEKVIYCTGYEAMPLAEKFGGELNRTYAITTSPVEDLESWIYRAMIWETKRPYFYMRTTEDGRIIAGGLDEDKMDADVSDEKLHDRGERLIKRIKEHFPDYEFSAEYVWAAAFGESEDGLPFIGEDPKEKGIYYCLGFGGNGTVYSKLGAKMLCEMFHDAHNPEEAAIVDPGRS
ncbi:NAD(P)/FAD-dependent oxidoreductase [Jeotgalibacillus salarius]|uniref:NAD(P)/FAD-dependent oxidoreductase n=1 Tax=Jeotgalibacillus salarius TaxID=546023 RepID=UPI001FC85E6E|nr:FAD-dependent oxidoreductase [Jeotgalibacillus salarius]